MLLQVILEGLGLGALLVLVCAMRASAKGLLGMVHLYSPAVQQRCVKLGLTSTRERIRAQQLCCSKQSAFPAISAMCWSVSMG